MLSVIRVRLIYIVFSILILSHLVKSTHIYMNSGETRCFYKRLMTGELLIGDIDTSVDKDGHFVEDSQVQVHITIDETFDKDERVLNQKNPYSGDFMFAALEEGEHRICIEPEYTINTKARIRVLINFEIKNKNILDSKQRDAAESLKNRIQQLSQRLHTLRSQQNTIRENEATFRDESEGANSKIASWSIIQILVLIVVCWFQLRYLKNFFVKQKIL